MPFRSEKQRRYLYAVKPDVAREFAAHYRTEPKPKRIRRKKTSPR